MNKENKGYLQAHLIRWGEDGSMDMFKKATILSFAHNDIEAIKEAFSEWEAAGAVQCLADFETALPDTMVVKIDLKKLTELDAEESARQGVEHYRHLNPEGRADFLRRLDGPKLRAEILQRLDPEERAQALRRLDPALLVLNEGEQGANGVQAPESGS